ncbi:unnamed protein product [Rhodiola kirilowii]
MAAASFSSSVLLFDSVVSLRSRQLISWKPLRTEAAISLDDDEKLLVGDTLNLKGIPDSDSEAGSEKPSDGSFSAVVERGVIKLEQTINILLTDSVIQILDTMYRDREYPRFFVLETIARVPYFAFMSVLHMYESFGWWRRADYLKVHFAESWNEMHHLLIMEELGGNNWWFDRFLAQHIAVFYYFMTVFMYILSPRMAYCSEVSYSQFFTVPDHFSECVESHAYETYDKFLKSHGDVLKQTPAPEVAVKYYTGGDLYLFDEFQTSRVPQTRRPIIENLYDVFWNIREDEGEHCKTMKACQTHGNLHSPHSVSEES